jgi:hypothetical protein
MALSVLRSYYRYKWNQIKKVNNPYTGLDRPLGPQDVEASRNARQLVLESGKIFSLRQRPTLPSLPSQEIYIVLISLTE